MFPNILHFIWAGQDIIPEREFNVVKQWAVNNPGYQINLWIDKETTPHADIDKLQTKIQNMGLNIVLKDITEEGVCDESVRIELCKPQGIRNYGISSDQLRYSILHKFGGMYLDCDVYPTDVRLPLNINSKQGILFSPWAQNEFKISNDILLVEPGNPLMKEIADRSRQSANQSYDSWRTIKNSSREMVLDASNAEYSMYSYENKTDGIKATRTLDSTGPAMLKLLLKEKGILQCVPHVNNYTHNSFFYNPAAEVITEYHIKDAYHINPDYLLGGDENIKPPYFSVSENPDHVSTKSWLDTNKNNQKTTPDNKVLMQDTLKAMQFEVHHWKLLRMKDYATALSRVTGKSLQECAIDLIEAMQNSNTFSLTEIQGIQFLPGSLAPFKPFYDRYMNIVENKIQTKEIPQEQVIRDVNDHLDYLWRIRFSNPVMQNITIYLEYLERLLLATGYTKGLKGSKEVAPIILNSVKSMQERDILLAKYTEYTSYYDYHFHSLLIKANDLLGKVELLQRYKTEGLGMNNPNSIFYPLKYEDRINIINTAKKAVLTDLRKNPLCLSSPIEQSLYRNLLGNTTGAQRSWFSQIFTAFSSSEIINENDYSQELEKMISDVAARSVSRKAST